MTPAFHMKKILLKVKQLTNYWEEPCLMQGMKKIWLNFKLLPFADKISILMIYVVGIYIV